MKYVSAGFFREPPSPYCSFHCISSWTMDASGLTLAATCNGEFHVETT